MTLLIRPVGLGGAADRIGRLARAAQEGKASASDLQPRLQDINFGCPWPLRESPYLEPARAHALAWMVEFGLVADPVANEAQYRDWKLGEGAAWFFPDATPDGLALAADLMGWYFAPFDDQFDGQLGRDMALSAQIIQDLLDVLALPDGAKPAVSHPVVVAFADVWRRSCQGMSPAWRERAAHHWKQYFVGQLGEVVNRAHKRKPDAVSHLRQRVATTSCRVLCDLMESVTGYEVPARAWYMPVLDEMRLLASEIIILTNDLVSAEKEEAAGDLDNNLLLILENQEGYTRPEAVEKLRQMTHERQERFLRIEQQIPDIDDVLDAEGRALVRRYVQGLHDLQAGDNEWEHTSGRYAVARPAAPTPAPAAPRAAASSADPAALAPPALSGLGTSAARPFGSLLPKGTP